jgi:hypothetical protein
MHIVRYSGAASAVLTLLAATSSGATPVPRRAAVRVIRPSVAAPARHRFARRGNSITATGCSSDYSGAGGSYFNAITSSPFNFAGGFDSSMLGGYDNAACDAASSIVAGNTNTIGGGTGNSFIGAGRYNEMVGASASIAGGEGNGIASQYAFIGGGLLGQVTGDSSFIGAGGSESDTAQGFAPATGTTISGTDSFIGAGDINYISGNGSFIGAGDYAYAAGGATTFGNTVTGNDSFVGAGDANTVESQSSFVGAGWSNSIAFAASYASIPSGQQNRVTATYGSVLGGFGNLASGSYAIVAGGDTNTAAGTLSLAGGYHADAAHNGSFVWSDYVSGSKKVVDTGVNQFVVRASGGTYLYSNEAQTAGVRLSAGSGSWASLSDRNAKTGIVPLDEASILAKVSSLPMTGWQYKSERGVRHLGPMAQDFFAAFGVGEDDRHITAIDEDGVALAAIKALNAKLASENGRLRSRVSRLEAANAIVDRREQNFEHRMEARDAHAQRTSR